MTCWSYTTEVSQSDPLSVAAPRRRVHRHPEREGLHPGEPRGRELWRPRLLRPQEDGRLQGGLPQAPGKYRFESMKLSRIESLFANIAGEGRVELEEGGNPHHPPAAADAPLRLGPHRPVILFGRFSMTVSSKVFTMFMFCYHFRFS